jgi:hypothetical protein
MSRGLRANPLRRRGGGGGTTGFSPDGTVIIGQPGGGSDSGPIITAYGTWDLGGQLAHEPTYGGGAMCRAMLNGQPVTMGVPTATGISAWNRMAVAAGGNLYAVTFDQLWYCWRGYGWVYDNSQDVFSGPIGIPIPGPLPSYNPPYTPSPDGSTISAGTGTLVTRDGIWTFGVVQEAGWDVHLNGIAMLWTEFDYPNIAADQLVVNSNGQMFMRTTFAPIAGTWRLWAGHQWNLSTGPTALPVPIGITFNPSMPAVDKNAPIGTHVSAITVTTSNGSGFAGVLSTDETTYTTISASALVTNISPMPFGAEFAMITAAQNGTDHKSMINSTFTGF